MILPILRMQSVDSLYILIDFAYELQLLLKIQRHVDGFPDCSERALGLEWQLWSAARSMIARKNRMWRTSLSLYIVTWRRYLEERGYPRLARYLQPLRKRVRRAQEARGFVGRAGARTTRQALLPALPLTTTASCSTTSTPISPLTTSSHRRWERHQPHPASPAPSRCSETRSGRAPARPAPCPPTAAPDLRYVLTRPNRTRTSSNATRIHRRRAQSGPAGRRTVFWAVLELRTSCENMPTCPEAIQGQAR